MLYFHRYEIREDRRRETLRSETYFGRLRGEILSTLRSAMLNQPASRRQTSTSSERFAHSSAPYGNRESEYTPRPPPSYDNNYSGRVQTCFDNSNEVFPFSEDPGRFQRKGLESHMNDRISNYTDAKIESYLRHLGEVGSSVTSDSGALPSLTTDPYKSHSGEVFVPRPTLHGNQLDNDNDPRGSLDGHSTACDGKSRLLTREDIESITVEIVESLRAELRETARDIALDLAQPPPNVGILPDLSSDLYQTHLYTQL